MAETVLFIAQNNTNYCPEWCLFMSKTTLIIVQNGAYLWLKQHQLLSGMVQFISITHSFSRANPI
jgi:hypothetical protein